MHDDGTFHVRLAAPADAAPLAELAVLLGQTLTSERFSQDIASHPKGFFVAHIDGRLVGYLVLRKHHAPPSLHVHAPVQLWRLYVAPALQGKGVAAGLMEQAVATALAWGSDSIWLGTAADNVRAIAFYRKHGFSALGKAQLHTGLDAHDDHDAHEDLIMLWKAD